MHLSTIPAAFAALALLAPAQDAKHPVQVPPVPDFTTSDAAVHGKEVAAYADLFDSGWKDEVSKGRMTLYDAGGDSVERVFSRMTYERA
ncbi:MAG: hypothetical protein AAFZ87_21175, partial [Planctomycetota bacterium]